MHPFFWMTSTGNFFIRARADVAAVQRDLPSLLLGKSQRMVKFKIQNLPLVPSTVLCGSDLSDMASGN
jgi:hypothetical protein